MSEHTPGPWYATPIYMPYDFEDAYGGEPVCWRVTDGEPWHEDGEYTVDIQVDTEADARLVASAPQLRAENQRLREALRDIVEMCEIGDLYADVVINARVALNGGNE